MARLISIAAMLIAAVGALNPTRIQHMRSVRRLSASDASADEMKLFCEETAEASADAVRKVRDPPSHARARIPPRQRARRFANSTNSQMSVEERVQRSMAAEAAEDRMMALAGELEDAIDAGDAALEAELRANMAATRQQYKDLVGGGSSLFVDAVSEAS